MELLALKVSFVTARSLTLSLHTSHLASLQGFVQAGCQGGTNFALSISLGTAAVTAGATGGKVGEWTC